MKSQGASSAPPPQHLHRGAAGPSSSPGNGFVPAASPPCSPVALGEPHLGGKPPPPSTPSRFAPYLLLAADLPRSAPPARAASLPRPRRHRPHRAERKRGARAGGGARTPRSGAQRRTVIRALWGRWDAGQEGCGQEQREAAGSPQAARPWQPGPGDGGMEGGGCGRKRRRRKEGG